MKKIRITRSIVPNLLTLVNLYCGYSAIIFATSHQFEKAALYIFLAAVFDVLDGFVARLVKGTSEFGAELDSLCDVVSFGVAPSFMLYQAFFYQFHDLGLLVSSFPALAGASRLARFNSQLVSLEDKKYFTGLPIPAGALTLISYQMFVHNQIVNEQPWISIIMFAVTILVSLVMVSTVKFNNIPRPSKSYIIENPVYSILFIVAIIASIITIGKAIFAVMVLYILFSLLRQMFVIYNSRQTDDDEIDIDDNEEVDEF